MPRKRKSPNAALIAALKEPKPIPYDPELMATIAENWARSEAKLENLRLQVYRDVLTWLGPALADAIRAHDPEAEKRLRPRANAEWQTVTGTPAITSWENLDIVRAHAVAAGYPNSDAGLQAWAQSVAKRLQESMQDYRPSDLAKVVDVSLSTLKRMREDGRLKATVISTKTWRVHRDEVARLKKS